MQYHASRQLPPGGSDISKGSEELILGRPLKGDTKFPDNPTTSDYLKLMDEDTHDYVKNTADARNIKLEDASLDTLKGLMAETRDRLKVASDYLSTPVMTYNDRTITAQNESFENSLLVRARSVYNADKDKLVDTKRLRKDLSDPDNKAKVRLIGEVGPSNPYYERTGNPAFSFGKVFSYDGNTFIVPMDARQTASASKPQVMMRHMAYMSMYDGKIHDVNGPNGEKLGTVEYNRGKDGAYIRVTSNGRPVDWPIDQFFSGFVPESINEE
jgi:hypothetical protein